MLIAWFPLQQALRGDWRVFEKKGARDAAKPEWQIQRETEQRIAATVASLLEAKAENKNRKLMAAEIAAILDEMGEL